MSLWHRNNRTYSSLPMLKHTGPTKCFSYNKVGLHSIRFCPLLTVFIRFFFSSKKYRWLFFVRIVHIRTNQTVTYWTKVPPPNFFLLRGTALFRNIALIVMHKIFEQNFYRYVTDYLVQTWTYKNADEKAHIFCGEVKT